MADELLVALKKIAELKPMDTDGLPGAQTIAIKAIREYEANLVHDGSVSKGEWTRKLLDDLIRAVNAHWDETDKAPDGPSGTDLDLYEEKSTIDKILFQLDKKQ